MISFVVTSYNYADYIKETIESVIKQTVSDWELVIVDDGSKDNSVDIINNYVKNDARIKLFIHEDNQNRGIIETIKLGIQNAKGEYVVFLESDDYIAENYLEEKLKIFDKYTNVGLLYNDIETFGEKLTLKRRLYFYLLRKYWKKHDYPHYAYEPLYIRNMIPTFSCVMLKKSILQDINWECPIPTVIDLWLWAQLAGKTQFYFLRQKLTYWRLHGSSYMNTINAGNKNYLSYYRGIYEFLPPIKSLEYKIKFFIKKRQVSKLLKMSIHELCN